MNREGSLSTLDGKLQSALEAFFGQAITVMGLSQINETSLMARSIIISTIEAEQPLLNAISEEDMKPVKTITNKASKIIWITNADLLSGTRPDFAPVLGLSRALMLEQPSIQFAVFDIDDVLADPEITARNVVNTMQQLIETVEPGLEIAQKSGVVHTLRWEPEEPLNEIFRLKQNEGTIDMTQDAAGRCELSIKQPGQLDTIHFVRKDFRDKLLDYHVEIQVKSVGMNAKVSHTRYSLLNAEVLA